MQLEVSNGTCGRSFERRSSAGRSRDPGGRRADELRVDAEAVGDHEQPVLVAGLRFADVERAVERAVEGRRADRRRCRSSSCRGSSAGASVSKFAWASVQAVWPSAASGLIVRPSGRVTVAERMRRRRGRAMPRNWAPSARCRARTAQSVSFGGQRRVEDRVEGLVFAAGRRRVAAPPRARVCPGPGRSARRAVTVSGCPVQTLGLSVSGVDGDPRRMRDRPDVRGAQRRRRPGQPAGLPGEPGRKRSLSWFVVGREAPDGDVAPRRAGSAG